VVRIGQGEWRDNKKKKNTTNKNQQIKRIEFVESEGNEAALVRI